MTSFQPAHPGQAISGVTYPCSRPVPLANTPIWMIGTVHALRSDTGKPIVTIGTRCPACERPTIGHMDGVLVFDGKCGMCTRVRNGLLRLNRTGRLRTEPMQKPGIPERVGVGPERLPESVWWLDSSGEVFSGAEAMNAALSTALGTPLPLRVYRVPGIGAAQQVVYRWVATHRHRFRGVTPLCDSDPQQCVSPQAS